MTPTLTTPGQLRAHLAPLVPKALAALVALRRDGTDATRRVADRVLRRHRLLLLNFVAEQLGLDAKEAAGEAVAPRPWAKLDRETRLEIARALVEGTDAVGR